MLDQTAQGADFTRLVGKVHGQVGVVPITQHAQANKVCLLQGNLLACVFAAQRAHLLGRQVLAVGSLDLVLDRQAVTIPARNVGCIKTRQGLGADNHVLDDLVQRMTDVNHAVGVGRAVVQDELRAPLADLANPLIQPVQTLEGLGFAVRQPGLHWEVRGGQVQCRFVVGHVVSGSRKIHRPHWALAAAKSALIAACNASSESKRCSSRSF